VFGRLGIEHTMQPNRSRRRDDPIVRETIASGVLLLATVGLLVLGFIGQAALF
jgi:hypothetical protein